MLYEALVNSQTLEMSNRETQEPLDAIAVIPNHAPDLEALVAQVPPELAGELARLAVWRAQGNELPPPKGFMR